MQAAAYTAYWLLICSTRLRNVTSGRWRSRITADDGEFDGFVLPLSQSNSTRVDHVVDVSEELDVPTALSTPPDAGTHVLNDPGSQPVS
jgi:hypothetical protein